MRLDSGELLGNEVIGKVLNIMQILNNVPNLLQYVAEAVTAVLEAPIKTKDVGATVQVHS